MLGIWQCGVLIRPDPLSTIHHMRLVKMLLIVSRIHVVELWPAALPYCMVLGPVVLAWRLRTRELLRELALLGV